MRQVRIQGGEKGQEPFITVLALAVHANGRGGDPQKLGHGVRITVVRVPRLSRLAELGLRGGLDSGHMNRTLHRVKEGPLRRGRRGDREGEERRRREGERIEKRSRGERICRERRRRVT